MSDQQIVTFEHGHKALSFEDTIRLARKVGRCELFDELYVANYIAGEKVIGWTDDIKLPSNEAVVDPNDILDREQPYPSIKYYKACRVMLYELGFDIHWIECMFRPVYEYMYHAVSADSIIAMYGFTAEEIAMIPKARIAPR